MPRTTQSALARAEFLPAVRTRLLGALVLQESLVVLCWLLVVEDGLGLGAAIGRLYEQGVLLCVFGSGEESFSRVFVSHRVLDGILHNVLSISA